MPELILHHYPMSPFSEKIRAMLGYTGLPWNSVMTREMPPRPHLQLLAGGYRKIPVAQIGADIFCDSRTIATEVARLSKKPELALENCDVQSMQFSAEVEQRIFFACVLSAASFKLNKKALKTLSYADLFKLIWDRLNMGRKASIRMVKASEAGQIVKDHLRSVDEMLTQDFLFGDTPTHADFSAYHSLWFIRDIGEKKTLDPYPRITAWMDRIKAFGNGTSQPMTIEESLAQAKQNQPREIEAQFQRDDAIGRTIQIAPDDYAQTPSSGTLVGSTPNQWIIARETDETGLVHVHFPKQGFSMKAF